MIDMTVDRLRYFEGVCVLPIDRLKDSMYLDKCEAGREKCYKDLKYEARPQK